MNRRLLSLALVTTMLSLAGCMTPAPKMPTHWLIDYDGVVVQPAEGTATFDGIRVFNVHVSSPYDTRRLTVLREDGTVAFDAYNDFAAEPAQMLRDVVQDSLRGCGRCANVVNAASSVKCRYTIELNVRTLALDCRKPGQRDATVQLYATIIEDRATVATGSGFAAVPVSDNFSVAFSQAFSQAMRNAFDSIRER